MKTTNLPRTIFDAIKLYVRCVNVCVRAAKALVSSVPVKKTADVIFTLRQFIIIIMVARTALSFYFSLTRFAVKFTNFRINFSFASKSEVF